LIFTTQGVTSRYIEDWNKDPEPFTFARTRCHIERIFIASAPWQHWLFHIYDVYRWEDPYETFRWLVLFLVLWHKSQAISFVFGYTIFITLRKRLTPASAASFREAASKVHQRSQAAQKLDKILASSGPLEVLSTLQADYGPFLQLQLNDIANLLEVLNNFSEWHAPRASLFTLILLSVIFVITAMGDAALCMRAVTFGAGVLFFFAFPVASRYPKYRYLVSPLKWLFWEVPTHAEWALAELRMEAQTNRERLISTKVMQEPAAWEERSGDISNDDGDAESFMSARSYGWTPLDGSEQIATYRCRQGIRRGTLVISPNGVNFETRRGQVLWRKEWKDLLEVRKEKDQGPTRLVETSSLALVFVFSSVDKEMQENEVRLSEMGRRRDEAFNATLGFSGLKWQWCG
jgi:hypothetical protein